LHQKICIYYRSLFADDGRASRTVGTIDELSHYFEFASSSFSTT